MSDAIYLSFVLAFIAKTKISEYLSTCLLHFQGEQHSPHRCRHSWPVRSGANIILSFFLRHTVRKSSLQLFFC